MIKVEKEYSSLYEYLTSQGESWLCGRDEVKTYMKMIDYELVHDELGDYDSGKNGFLVFKSPEGELWKVDFQDDSYSSGYVSSVCKVTKKTKTITVWEHSNA